MIHVPHYAECRVVLMRLRVLAQQRCALADCASDPARFLMHTNAEPRAAHLVSFRFALSRFRPRSGFRWRPSWARPRNTTKP